MCAILFTDCYFPFQHLQHSLWISHRLSHLLVDFLHSIYSLIIIRWSFVDYFPGTNYFLIKFNRNGNRTVNYRYTQQMLVFDCSTRKKYTQNNSRWRFSEWQLVPVHLCSTWITEMALTPFNGVFEFFHYSFISILMSRSELCSQNASEFNRNSEHSFVLFWIQFHGTSTRNTHQKLVKSIFSQYSYDTK